MEALLSLATQDEANPHSSSEVARSDASAAAEGSFITRDNLQSRASGSALAAEGMAGINAVVDHRSLSKNPPSSAVQDEASTHSSSDASHSHPSAAAQELKKQLEEQTRLVKERKDQAAARADELLERERRAAARADELLERKRRAAACATELLEHEAQLERRAEARKPTIKWPKASANFLAICPCVFLTLTSSHGTLTILLSSVIHQRQMKMRGRLSERQWRSMIGISAKRGMGSLTQFLSL